MKQFSAKRTVAVIFLAWLAVLGFDLLLHGGILADFYARPDPFLLPPAEAFRRIPFGYASFLIAVIFLAWLMKKLNIHDARGGAKFGLIFGAVMWGSLGLGLLSISTAGMGLLAGWFIGQTIESGLAGLVLGAGFEAERLRGLAIRVGIWVLVAFAITVVLQNI